MLALFNVGIWEVVLILACLGCLGIPTAIVLVVLWLTVLRTRGRKPPGD